MDHDLGRSADSFPIRETNRKRISRASQIVVHRRCYSLLDEIEFVDWRLLLLLLLSSSGVAGNLIIRPWQSARRCGPCLAALETSVSDRRWSPSPPNSSP